ncbi:YkgJ family cysteine cluster protein [Candidatus Woesearchaeota archaeon]|nr:YkgJ family cysteine cluster protein [Candidatus Woesearchaeota archaeon]
MKPLLTKENFKCDRYCGECCKKMLVAVSNKDIKNIEKLGYKKESFVMKDVFNSKRKFLKKEENGWCVFLEKEKDGKYSCKIHKDRPEVCQKYPFFPGTPKEIKSCLPEDLYPNVFFKMPSRK